MLIKHTFGFTIRLFKVPFLLFLVSVTFQLSGQVQHINFRHYSLADGLSSYKVVKILQDRFGFMWIATQDGLNKFDGKDIVIYNKSAGENHLLLGGDIADIIEDSTLGMLWVISPYGGLNGIDLKTGKVMVSLSVSDTRNRFTDSWLRTLMLNGEQLWIGTSNGISIYNTRQGKIEKNLGAPPYSVPGNKEFDINLLFKDEAERIWAFSNLGITVYSGKDHSVVASASLDKLGLPDEYAYKRFNSYGLQRPGHFLLGTYKGIRRISYSNSGFIEIYAENMPGNADKEIRYLMNDRHHNIWFATNSGLFRRNFDDKDALAIIDVNDLDNKRWLNSLDVIYFDRDNNIWLGALQGFALAVRSQTPFMKYFESADQKTKISRAKYIFPLNDSTELVCAYDGFYKVQNLSNNVHRLREGLFWTVFPDHQSNLILSREKRLYVFKDPDQFVPVENIYPELEPIKFETLNSSVTWGDSLFFLGSEDGKGVFIWDHKNKTLRKFDTQTPVRLEDKVVNKVFKDRQNRVWVLGDNSLAVYDPSDNRIINRKLSNPSNGQPLTLFFDICEAGGYYWLASYGSGIVQIDNQFSVKNVVSIGNGLNNAGLYKIFSLSDSILLATSNNGLSKVNMNDLTASNYFESDGLHSNAFEEGCGTVYNGKIYVGGPDGFTIIDPKYITTNTAAPELYINRIVMVTQKEGQELSDLSQKTVTLPRNLLQATIHFSALNYANPGRTTYAYRIKGQQDEWVNLRTQNFVNLIGLKPDTYTLQVQAFNEDKVASAIKEIQLIFLPKWYQTMWFKLLVVALSTAIIFLLYKLRVNQLKKEKEIRSHLASDLHDDLGSTLNSVKVYANMALVERENQNYLEKIKESTQEAIIGVRDIIWVLDDKKDSLDDLLARIRLFANPLCAAGNISFQQQINDFLYNQKLGKEEKRNLYMIIKEAVNNSVKYAKGNLIQLSVYTSNGKLIIKVTDNGNGYDTSATTEGNGLKNIMNRSQQIGYKVTILSAEGQGTTVQLEKK